MANLDAALKRADDLDDAILSPAQDVGEVSGWQPTAIQRVTSWAIENPHFKLP